MSILGFFCTGIMMMIGLHIMILDTIFVNNFLQVQQKYNTSICQSHGKHDF